MKKVVKLMLIAVLAIALAVPLMACNGNGDNGGNGGNGGGFVVPPIVDSPPSNPDDLPALLEEMEEAGWDVDSWVDEGVVGVGGVRLSHDNLENVLEDLDGATHVWFERFSITYFETEASATAYYNELREEMASAVGYEERGGRTVTYSINRTGTVVSYAFRVEGTAQSFLRMT